MRPIDAHHNGVRWEGEFAVDVLGPLGFAIEAWTDLFATWRDEIPRKVAAAQDGPLRRALRGRRPVRARRAREGRRRQRAVEHALTCCATRRDAPGAVRGRALDPSSPTRWSARRAATA